ncbi:MAG: hypothetical protein ACR2LV_11530 [Solirubrobacteraceae bacterium]
MRRRLLLTVLSAVLGTLALMTLGSPSALAGQSSVVSDCNTNNRLTHHYSVPQLRDALATMGADVKQYTNCYDVIDSALLAQLGATRQGGSGGAPSSSSGGSFLSTPLVVVLVLLALAALTLGAVAVRRRGRMGGESSSESRGGEGGDAGATSDDGADRGEAGTRSGQGEGS